MNIDVSPVDSDLQNDLEDLDQAVLEDALSRISSRVNLLEAIRDDTAHDRVATHEPKERIQAFARRRSGWGNGFAAAPSEAILEAQVGGTNDIVSIEFLEQGQLAGQPVGRVSVAGDWKVGSGFLVGEGLFLTNHHVLPVPGLGSASRVRFNYEDNRFGRTRPQSEFLVKPEEFWLSDKDLDFTLVALSTHDDVGTPVQNFGWHPLPGDEEILQGMPVNIIQHPGGGHKSIAVHNSHFLLVEDGSDADAFCWYSGDTKKGSSGSPVFSNDWQVVALHHQAVPRTNDDNQIVDRNDNPISKEDFKKSPEKADYVANEGIRASRLLKAIEDAQIPDPQWTQKRDALLELWASDAAKFLKRRFPATA